MTLHKVFITVPLLRWWLMNTLSDDSLEKY